jgi:hypothetical protein
VGESESKSVSYTSHLDPRGKQSEPRYIEVVRASIATAKPPVRPKAKTRRRKTREQLKAEREAQRLYSAFREYPRDMPLEEVMCKFDARQRKVKMPSYWEDCPSEWWDAWATGNEGWRRQIHYLHQNAWRGVTTPKVV